MENADPDSFWQWVQWHSPTPAGSPFRDIAHLAAETATFMLCHRAAASFGRGMMGGKDLIAHRARELCGSRWAVMPAPEKHVTAATEDILTRTAAK
jgi:hypothetical protein